jgi:molybdopterin/thiamine biosynthesis adenylyltransferase
MTVNMDHDRQRRLWGDVGQRVLSDARLVIVGADRLGAECAKTASLLGVGNICIIDNSEARGEKFLDQKMEGPRAKSLEHLIPKFLNKDCNVLGIRAPVSKAWIRSFGDVDGVIDTTNSTSSQYLCYEFCRSTQHFANKEAAFFAGAADAVQGKISYYAPGKQFEHMPERYSICIPGFEANRQGIIISNILSGVLIEEFRKWLFLQHADEFKKVHIGKRDGTIFNKKGERLTYYKQYLESTKMLEKDFEYSINGFYERKVIEKDHLASERGLEGRRILVLGCGAIGTSLCDMLARLNPGKVDVVDMDIFKTVNLPCQPFAYDGIDRHKAEVVAEKINRIADRQVARPIIGFVGDNFNTAGDESIPLNAALLNAKWFSDHKNDYDVIFGCFDNLEARLAVTKYAASMGMNYVDGGSGGQNDPTQARASVYAPKKTNCLLCTHDNYKISENGAAIARAQLEANDAQREELVNQNREMYDDVVLIGRLSCGEPWVDGSIYMSNKIAAGFMLGEARKIFHPPPENLVDFIVYTSMWGSELDLPEQELRCKCGQ